MVPPSKDLGQWPVGMCLMKSLDHGGRVGKVFGWFPACCIWGIVKPFPLDQVEQARALATVIKLAVEDPIDLPLVGIGQLDWWWWVDYLVGDTTRNSGLQESALSVIFLCYKCISIYAKVAHIEY